LFDIKGAEYKYYEYHLAQEELALSSELHGVKSAHTGIVLPVLCGYFEDYLQSTHRVRRDV
jgi:hypothetical protein